MEIANETEVSEPAAVAAQTEAESDWYWCPSCKLASSKSGNCPGCRAAYVAVPTAGVPDTPHAPRIRAGRSRAAVLGSVAGVVGLLGAAAASIVLLAIHGAGTVDSGDTAAMGTSLDGTASFSIGTLHGTLRLQGAWGASMAQLGLPTDQTAGAPVKTVLSIGKGSELILVGTFASPDPAGALNQFVVTKPTSDMDNIGNKTTTEASRDVSIAGYTAVAQNFEVRNGKGGLTSRGTVYAINAGDHMVIIRTVAGPTQVNDLAGIEQALVNIG